MHHCTAWIYCLGGAKVVMQSKGTAAPGTAMTLEARAWSWVVTVVHEVFAITMVENTAVTAAFANVQAAMEAIDALAAVKATSALLDATSAVWLANATPVALSTVAKSSVSVRPGAADAVQDASHVVDGVNRTDKAVWLAVGAANVPAASTAVAKATDTTDMDNNNDDVDEDNTKPLPSPNATVPKKPHAKSVSIQEKHGLDPGGNDTFEIITSVKCKLYPMLWHDSGKHEYFFNTLNHFVVEINMT